MVCEVGSKWPNNFSFVGFYKQGLFKTVRTILVSFSSSFFFKRFARDQVVQPNCSTAMATICMNFRFFLSERLDFHITDIQAITSLLVDEILLSMYMSWSTNLRGSPFDVEMTASFLKHMNFALSSRLGQYLLLHAPDNATRIRLGFMYLREVLDHWQSLH